MQGLHCTHFLKHQYPSTPYALFPTYLRTGRGPRASAVLLFYTDQMKRVHSSEEAPRSFTMAPCVIVERLEGKQRCSRAAVGEHEGIQAREWSRWLFTKKRKVNEKWPNPATAHHTIKTAPRSDNTRSFALVQRLSTQFMARPSCELTSRCSEIGFTFSPFSRRFYFYQSLLHPRFNFCSKCLNSLYSSTTHWLTFSRQLDGLGVFIEKNRTSSDSCGQSKCHVYSFRWTNPRFEHVCICGMRIRVCVDVICHGRMIRKSAQTNILSGSLFASQFLMSVSALFNIMRSTALDFGHQANSRLSSNRITFRQICLATI